MSKDPPSPSNPPSRQEFLARHWALAAVLTALLTIPAFPDFGLWALAPLAPVPLLLALPALSRGRAFLAGWLSYGLTLAGVFHWLVPTAINLAGFPAWGGAGVLVAYSVAYGLNGGVLGLLVRGALRAPVPAWARLLLAAAAWTAVDVFGPHLFPFGLGNLYWRVPVLLQGAEVTGIEGATFVTVALSVALALAIPAVVARRRPPVAALAVAAALAALWAGYGAVRLPAVREAEAAAPVLRVLMVQPDVRPEEKRRKDLRSKQALVDRLVRLTGDADLAGVDVVVWPEGSWPFEWDPPPGGVARTVAQSNAVRLQLAVAQSDIPLVFGSITRPAGRARNTMVHLGPDGAERARFDKRLLLAFGEYLPLSDTFPSLKGRIAGVGNLEPGDRWVAFDLAGHPAAASVCYEAVQSGLTRDAVADTGAELILNLTNDGWFGTSGAPAQHLMVQVPRAVELRRPLVRSTMTGISAVVRASGDLSDETGVYTQAVVRADVPVPGLPPTPFAVAGRWLAWACLAASAGRVLISAGRSRARR